MTSLNCENVLLLFERISHHSDHSGYDRLAGYLGQRPRFSPRLRDFPGFDHFARILKGASGMAWYGGFETELSAALEMMRSGPRLYHFLYGENDYRFTYLVPWRKQKKILATFHTPPAVFERVMRKVQHLKYLDAAVVVSTTQLRALSSFLGEDRVHFVPHGIDTSFFVPGGMQVDRRENACLCVGHHLRDFSMLCEVASVLRKENASVKLLLVDKVFFQDQNSDAADYYVKRFRDLGNVDLCLGMEEDELLRAYQTMTVLILPLRDTTANNSLLEAMACGLPIVVSDVGGIRDYLDDESAVLVPPGDVRQMAESVLSLLDSPARRRRIGQNSRERALRYDWNVVARQMKRVYENLLNSR